jgi:purine-nucleoside phosphorylase
MSQLSYVSKRIVCGADTIKLTSKNNIQASYTYIRKKTDFKPRIALILGSGLGDFGSRVNSKITINSSEIPNYPISSVQGHAGKLIFGFLQSDLSNSVPILVFQGRVHFYETGSINKVIFPVILAKQLGVKKLIITNAAGGINARFKSGDLMLIRDVINLTMMAIPNLNGDSKYRHMKYFDSDMQQTVIGCSSHLNIPLQQGTYCWLKGPTYETPSEIQMLKHIGADAVGMSTVPELVVAKQLGLKTAGISLISNLAAGISTSKLSHAEVTETANKVKQQFSELMENIILSLK